MLDPLCRIIYAGSSLQDPLYRILCAGSSVRDPQCRIICAGSSVQDPLCRILYECSSVHDPLNSRVIRKAETPSDWCFRSKFVTQILWSLNKTIQRHTWVFLSPEDMCKRLPMDTKVLAKFDFLAAYHQFSLEEGSIPLTQFMYHG